MKYFISDPHSNHDAEFIVKERGFDNVEKYNEALIDGINYLTRNPEDELYILGDVGKKPLEFLGKLVCGEIHVIRGNHDNGLYSGRMKSKNIELHNEIFETNIGTVPVVLCHYPMVSWNRSHWGSWLLYGHVHHKELPIKGKMLDVAPTAEHMFPYSEKEIEEIMKTLPNNWDLIKDAFS